ncbi:MAG TPA: hypothetical protein VF039_11190 [Longimicrobiales bacterium]
MNFRFRSLVLALALTPTLACEEEPTRPTPDGDAREHAVVLNSVGLTLSVFATDSPDSVVTIPLGASGSPTTLAVHEGIALVPFGTVSAVMVVDLAAGVVLDVIALPANGGATGVAIVDDSLAFVANPELNSVSPVRYRDGIALDAIDVGIYPTALVAHEGSVYVLEANLVDFAPDGPSTVSVIDAHALEVDTTFALSGRNAGDGLISGDSVLYVLHRGDYGLGNGAVSVVPLPGVAERERFDGFGEGTGTLSELDGDLLISSYEYGLVLYDPEMRDFLVAPEDGVSPPDAANVLGAGVDRDGRLYAIDARDCTQPGRVWVWTGALGDVGDAEPVTAGACPIEVVFTTF